MTALKLELSIRAAATRTGGGGPPVLANDGVLLTAFNDKLVIRDTVTPANAYDGVPSAKIVTTRASTAYYYSVSGVLTQVAVNTLRLDYDPRLSSNAPGYLCEDARTNIVLWSNDLTNVAWVKTNVTAVKDQTGPDNAASSASKITATVDNGTVIQTTAVASAVRYQSAYVKRVTGTGVVSMTMDNGTTWTPVTVTSAWTRVEIPTQTLANPPVGFRIATSGDAIAVFGVQNENSLFASSLITTTTAATTRAGDVSKLAGTLFPLNSAEGTIYAKAMMLGDASAGSQILLHLDDGTNTERIGLDRVPSTKKMNLSVFDNNVQQVGITSVNTYLTLSLFKASGGYKLNDSAMATSGETMLAPDASCTMPTLTTMVFGARSVSASTVLNGWILEGMYLSTRLIDTQLAALVA